MDSWRPIDTAPKDGTEVIGLYGRKKIALCWYFRPSSNTEGWLDQNGNARRPTHWMPLPPPPKQGEG